MKLKQNSTHGTVPVRIIGGKNIYAGKPTLVGDITIDTRLVGVRSVLLRLYPFTEIGLEGRKKCEEKHDKTKQ